MTRVAVVGAAGYAGIETVRWIVGHPRFELVMATSGADAGRPLAQLYPALAGRTELSFVAPDVERIASEAEVAFLAVPHTAAMAMVPALVEAGLKVIDLSADFRLADPDVYSSWYGVDHTATHMLQTAVYGLPEFDRSSLASAALVACPGCYPTASALAAFPALQAGLAEGGTVVVDAKSGVSGAGRTPAPTTHYVAATESLTPYKVGTHRHTPEIEQTLSRAAGRDVSVMFTPHLVPMSRGLLATAYIPAGNGVTGQQAFDLYRERFESEPFVRVLEYGQMPSTSHVRGTNDAAIGLHLDERTATLVVACAIDNLGKGSAGQAVQCANAVFGMDETTGLIQALAPVV